MVLSDRGETICSSVYVPVHGKLLESSGVCALSLQHTDVTPWSTEQEATFLLHLCNGATFFSFQDSAVEVAHAPCSVYFQHMAEGVLLNPGQSFSATKLYVCSSVCVCMHACVWVMHECTRIALAYGGQGSAPGIFFLQSALYLLRESLTLNPGLISSARLARQQVPGIHSSQPPTPSTGGTLHTVSGFSTHAVDLDTAVHASL